MKDVLIIGVSHESINAAIWLASINKSVRVLAEEVAIDEVLSSYKFDHQMSALWHMYRQSGQITFAKSLSQADCIWLFVDGVTDELIWQLLPLPSPLIISGSKPIGQIAQIASKYTGDVCYVPFIFLQDGQGFASISSPDLVLIGEKSAECHQKNAILLALLAKAERSYVADITTIEFARSSIMAMLATRLSFINEMARLADVSDVDILKVQQILGLDKRIGKDYLSAGWGFGGYTLPTETTILGQYFAKNQVASPLLNAVTQINDDQKELLFRKFWQYFDGFIDQKTVMIWGAGYRRGTGRTIGSAIHPLLKLLWSYGIKTHIYAPNAGFELGQMYRDEPLFTLHNDAYALEGVDALFVLNWSDLLPVNLDKITNKQLPIFDGKNLFDEQMIAQLPNYQGVGRCTKILNEE